MALRNFAICFLLLISGCASNVPLTATASTSSGVSKIDFIDIAKFDQELSSSLKSQPSEIEVSFFNKVSPNNVPDRLQKWISVVEAGGGKVLVEPPPNESVSRSPFAALSLVGTLISSIKNFNQFNSEKIYESAKGRNVVIALERNSNSEVLISRIKFIKRAP